MTTAEDLFVAELVGYDPGAGLAPIADWATVGDASWTNVGTPTRSAAAARILGYPLDLIGDDDGAAFEQVYRLIGFTGNGDKILSFLVKRSSAYASHQVALTDNTASAYRLVVNVNFSAAVPAITISGVGAVLAVVPVLDGYWVIAKATGVVAANANRLFVTPAGGAAGDTAAFYIGVVRAWDSATYVGPRLLTYATRGFATTPSEYPANQLFDERLIQPAAATRTLFAPGTTRGRSTLGFGDLELTNGDGQLDTLLAYGFDGWPLTIRCATFGAAYPGGFSTMLVATAAGRPEVSEDKVVVKIRDRQAELALPLQTTKYLGTGGLEGTAELTGKAKPLLFGSALNLQVPCVNTAKLIHQVNDGAFAALDGVFDEGILLGWPTKWAAQTVHMTGVNGIVYGGAQYVIVGANIVGPNVEGRIETSANGAVWTDQGNGGFTGASPDSANAVAYNGVNLYVAVGNNGKIASSPTGVVWTQRASGVADALRAVVYATELGLWVAAGASGALVTSPDGVTWTVQASGFGGYSILCLAWNGSTLVAGSANVVGGKVAYSTDGVTWTQTWSSNGTNFHVDWNAVDWLRDEFVMVGGGGICITSPDGKNWTQRITGYEAVGASGSTATDLYSVTYAQGVYVLGPLSTKIIIGPDLSTLGQYLHGIGGGALRGVAHDTVGQFVGVFGGAGVATSVNGEAYASLADLQDDTKAPSPGTWKVYLAGGYFRLGSTPAGLVTCDATAGATAADRTSAQLYKQILTRAGKGAADWVAGDYTALDAAFPAVCGLWFGPDAAAAFADAADRAAANGGAAWYVDRVGLFRIFQLIVPAGSPVAAWTANDLKKPPVRITPGDVDGAVPAFRAIVHYARNNTVQTTGLAAVSDARRAFLAQPDSASPASDLTVKLAHLLAVELDEVTDILSAADAATEASRRLALRKVPRDTFNVEVPLDSVNVTVDVASLVRLTHPRFGLAGGKLFWVLKAEPNAADRSALCTIWG